MSDYYEIECIPTGLVLASRGIEVGSIHEVLREMAAPGKRARGSRRPTGHMGAEVLARCLCEPYVVNAGPYEGVLAAGQEPDLGEVLASDVLSAIYQLRSLAGTPIRQQPNCQACGKLAPEPIEIWPNAVDHFECSAEGKAALAQGGQPLEIRENGWVIRLSPPVVRRAAAVDKLIEAGSVPRTISLDAPALCSISDVRREDGGPVFGAGLVGLSQTQKKAVDALSGQVVEDEATGQERPQAGPSRRLTVLSDIVRWWAGLRDWGLVEVIRDAASGAWGSVDTFYRWTCSADPTVCRQEQEEAIPLGPEFFGISGVRTSARSQGKQPRRPSTPAGPQS